MTSNSNEHPVAIASGARTYRCVNSPPRASRPCPFVFITPKCYVSKCFDSVKPEKRNPVMLRARKLAALSDTRDSLSSDQVFTNVDTLQKKAPLPTGIFSLDSLMSGSPKLRGNDPIDFSDCRFLALPPGLLEGKPQSKKRKKNPNYGLYSLELVWPGHQVQVLAMVIFSSQPCPTIENRFTFLPTPDDYCYAFPCKISWALEDIIRFSFDGRLHEMCPHGMRCDDYKTLRDADWRGFDRRRTEKLLGHMRMYDHPATFYCFSGDTKRIQEWHELPAPSEPGDLLAQLETEYHFQAFCHLYRGVSRANQYPFLNSPMMRVFLRCFVVPEDYVGKLPCEDTNLNLDSLPLCDQCSEESAVFYLYNGSVTPRDGPEYFFNYWKHYSEFHHPKVVEPCKFAAKSPEGKCFLLEPHQTLQLQHAQHYHPNM